MAHCSSLPRGPSSQLSLSHDPTETQPPSTSVFSSSDCFPSKTSSLTRVYRPCPSCILSSAHFLHLSSRRPHSNLWPVLIPWTCQAAPTSAPLPCSCLPTMPPPRAPHRLAPSLCRGSPFSDTFLSVLSQNAAPPHTAPPASLPCIFSKALSI